LTRRSRPSEAQKKGVSVVRSFGNNGANSPPGHFRLADGQTDTETGHSDLADGTLIHSVLVSLDRFCLANAVNHGFGVGIDAAATPLLATFTYQIQP
jgi:hypothetical protein